MAFKISTNMALDLDKVCPHLGSASRCKVCRFWRTSFLYARYVTVFIMRINMCPAAIIGTLYYVTKTTNEQHWVTLFAEFEFHNFKHFNNAIMWSVVFKTVVHKMDTKTMCTSGCVQSHMHANVLPKKKRYPCTTKIMILFYKI